MTRREEREAGAAVAFMVAVALAAACFLAACCKPCPPPATPQTIVVEKPAVQCLKAPPPTKPHLVGAACPGFDACYSLDESLALRRWAHDATGYMRDAWLNCGPPPAPKSP